MKKCHSCGELKPLEEFHANKNLKDGKTQYCKKCAIQKTKLWVSEHPDIVKKYNKEYYLLNKEKCKERARLWALRNPERRQAIKDSWYQQRKGTKVYREKRNRQNKELYYADIERSRAHVRSEQAKRRRSILEVINWDNVLKHYGNRCVSCLRSDVPLEVDHIIPISKGGMTVTENVQPLCRSCNAKKSAHTILYRLC